MGRRLAILTAFAVLTGVSLYWAPIRLQTPEPSSNVVIEKNEGNSAENGQDNASAAVTDASSRHTLESARRAAGQQESAPREPVLMATSPVPTSPLGALPEKAIPGFPSRPQRTLQSDPLASVIKQAKYLCDEGKLVDARDLLSDTYLGNRLTREQRIRLAEEVEPLAWEILRSHQIPNHGQVYEVEAGDVLIKIAKPFHVTPEFVMRLNGLKNPKSIRPGQRLKLAQGPFDVLAEISEFELTVLHHGKFVRRFSIGVGKSETPTPLGLFKVGTKLLNPTYYPPPSDTENRRPIPPGQPGNPLGTRWIDIGLGYGIHGTAEENSVGQESSRGCLRMRNADVEELYDMVTEASRVLIRQ